MGEEFLIDSNTLIEYQGRLIPPAGHDFVTKIIDERFIISIINRIEVLGSKAADKAIEDFINLAESIELTSAIANRAIGIRKTKKIKLPDAIIAATAIEYNLTLVTRNTKDFSGIGLDIVNPHEITSTR
ncbi:MAG TPA: type II toxin-antitoxin system VapC family toxin [Bacteroidia bacterium]|nr:type II toxin-antitoxin system VapC family toxin [Bacteroidia bacterium]